MINYLKENKTEVILVACITIFAFLLRLISLKNFGNFWIDEIFSSYFATKSSATDVVKTLCSEDLHVPLYFVLLHFWSKLFGETPTLMRLMGVIISTLTIPASYFIVKDLFKSKLSAFCVALFLSISAFNIHYSVELRFYGISILFALVATYYFVKCVQGFEKKYVVAYVISTLLLLYTYNFSFMYVFCQFVIGLIYLFKENKQNLPKFILTYFKIAVFYLPMFLFILIATARYNTSILKFVRDVFYFDITWFWTYFITVFSNFYQQFIMNQPLLNFEYIKNIFQLKMFVFVYVPMFLGILGTIFGIKNLKSENKNYALFFTPAFLLLFIQIVLVFNHSLALIYRYTIISTTFLLIFAVLGFFELKKYKKIALGLLIIWFLLNSLSYFVLTKNYPVFNRQIEYTMNLKNEADKLNITSEDIVLIPCHDKLFKKEVPNGRHFSINLYDSFYLGIRPNDVKFVFGEELAKKLNRDNAKTYLYPYIVFDEPLLELKKNMQNEIFAKMNSGQRFIIVSDEELKNLKYNQAFLQQGIEYYQRSAIGNTLMAKIISDMINFSKQDLNFVKYIKVSEMFYIYVFEKE